MQKRSSQIGTCSKGHDVYVTHHINGEIDGGTVGMDVVKPFPDGKSVDPIIVACEECAKRVRERIVSGL